MRTVKLGLCVIATMALLSFASACSQDESTTTPPAALSAPPPPPASAMPKPLTFEIASDLPPVPGNIENGAAPPQMVRAAYEFAARHPEVLKYIPCFCSCERMGHAGNDDCFVSKRDKSGKPTEWETHGLICEICIDVANTAMQMHNSGASTSAIREAIEKRYEKTAHGHTPTPNPPKRGAGGTPDHHHQH